MKKPKYCRECGNELVLVENPVRVVYNQYTGEKKVYTNNLLRCTKAYDGGLSPLLNTHTLFYIKPVAKVEKRV